MNFTERSVAFLNLEVHIKSLFLDKNNHRRLNTSFGGKLNSSFDTRNSSLGSKICRKEVKRFDNKPTFYLLKPSLKVDEVQNLNSWNTKTNDILFSMS